MTSYTPTENGLTTKKIRLAQATVEMKFDFVIPNTAEEGDQIIEELIVQIEEAIADSRELIEGKKVLSSKIFVKFLLKFD